MLKQRTIVTVIGIPLTIALIWLGSPWFTLFAVVWGVFSAYEFYRVVRYSQGIVPLSYFGMVWVALVIVSPQISQTLPLPVILTGAVVLPLLFLLWRKDKPRAFLSWAWTIGGILYIGWLLSYLVGLRNLNDGRDWVFLSMLSTFGSDVFAFIFGRAFGKHKLAPYISPKKTWEGAAAGVVGSILVSLVVVYISHLPVSYLGAVLFGILISFAGQLGDLVKSLFKRNMTVKDSSNLIPGHGGFLDRMDSQAFAGVAVYYCVVYLVGKF